MEDSDIEGVEIINAVKTSNMEVVRSYVSRTDPEADAKINHIQRFNNPLLVAINMTNLKMVELLLSYPNIDVNVSCCSTGLSFTHAMSNYQYLLRDMNDEWWLSNQSVERQSQQRQAICDAQVIFKLLVIHPSFDYRSAGHALNLCIRFGYYQFVKLLLAAGCQKNQVTKQVIKRGYHANIRKILREADKRRAYWRIELGLDMMDMIANTFALVVCLSDDYFILPVSDEHSNSNKKRQQAYRFFSIVRQIPMELQMLICNRVYQCHSNFVLSKNVETHFERLLA